MSGCAGVRFSAEIRFTGMTVIGHGRNLLRRDFGMASHDDGQVISVAEAIAWLDLRDAIAAEFVSKLPPSMSLRELGVLFGCSVDEIELMIALGELSVHGRSPSQFVVPAENLPLLRREMLLRLPLGQ